MGDTVVHEKKCEETVIELRQQSSLSRALSAFAYEKSAVPAGLIDLTFELLFKDVFAYSTLEHSILPFL